MKKVILPNEFCGHLESLHLRGNILVVLIAGRGRIKNRRYGIQYDTEGEAQSVYDAFIADWTNDTPFTF